MEFGPAIRWTGIASAGAVVILQLAYLVTLAIGLLSLPTPDTPIADPMFTILELLILLLMPPMVALMAALHAWAANPWKPLALVAVVFMAITAALTSAVHFGILTLSRQPAFAGLPHVFEFRWPSLVYVIDILAWDGFFALSVLAAAPVLRGSALARTARWLLILSGLLSLAGLSGVFTANMQLRNIGILGYTVVFMIAAGILGLLFVRTPNRAGVGNPE